MALILTLREGERAVIEADGDRIEVSFSKANGRQKASIRISAPNRFSIHRESENPADQKD